MIEKREFHIIEELRRLQYFAIKCSYDVGLHSSDGSAIVDMKSYIGICMLNLKEPILVVNESKKFLDMIEDIGEMLEWTG